MTAGRVVVSASSAQIGAGTLLAPVLAHAVTAAAAVAIRAGRHELTYGALVAAMNGLAGALRDAGAMPGDVIALPALRTPETITALLGIVASGAAYLPLDPDYPHARLAAIIEDARPRLAIGDLAASAHSPLGLHWIDSAAGAAITPPAYDEGDLAYVLFTSGSTGRPKGVAMRRAAVMRLIEWHAKHARLGAPARTLQFAPLGFDVSFQEIFSTLVSGGTLVLPDESERRDPYALLELLVRERIERLFVPYVALQALAEAVAAGGEVPYSLRDVITAGEQLRITPAIRALFAALPDAVLHNHYGPTETHVVTVHELSGATADWPELPPIGAPLPHVRVRVVDTSMNEVAAGEEGELLLGGDCLAAGYINRPELTAERFIERAGSRWYRSGDRVRQRADGTLDYLGRLDEQIKIDGFRIEPGEIEATLCRHSAVAEAVVLAVAGAGGRHLVAHVVARDPHLSADKLAPILSAHCMASLAAYLVPQHFVLHAALPLTASGKIDRRALAREMDAPPLRWRDGDSLQDQLLDMWKQLLSIDALDASDNLFDRGARSLIVVRALTELRRHGHVLSATQIYEHPSVSALVAALETKASATSGPHANVDGHARGAAQRAALARFGPRPGQMR